MQSLVGARVLVTGARGFLGSHVVDRLVSEGAFVGALSRRPPISAISSAVALQCDVRDADSTIGAIARFRPEILFHFVAHPDGPERFDHFRAGVDTNVMATIHVLEGFRQSGGRLLVYGDSSKVYGGSEAPYDQNTLPRPISSYAITKLAAWEFCQLYSRLYGIDAVSLRPTMTYGPRQSFNLISYVVESVLSGKAEIRLDGGSQTRQPLYVDDAIDAFVRAAQQGSELSGRVINIGGGRECRVSELAETIVELMGGGIPIVPVAANVRPTEMPRSCCDNTEAQRLIGWSPRTTLRDGLRRTIQALTESFANRSR